jgi:hypothetical protein
MRARSSSRSQSFSLRQTVSHAGLWRVLLLLATASWPLVALGSSDEDRCRIHSRKNCIDSPREYQHHWEDRTVKCVDPSLYGTAPQTTDRFLYPKAFHYAWATGSTNLEKYLEINCRYDEGDAINAIESFIGFPVNPATQAMSNSSEFPALELPLYVYNLNAFKRRDRDRPAEVRVPSFQEWFKILEDEFGLVVPLEEQRSLVLHYSDIPAFREYELFDVVDLYTQITGCTQDGEEWNAPPVRDVGCKDWPFKQTQAAAGVRKVGEGSISSKRCILNFKRSGVPRTAGSIRVLLDVCQDANAESGLGTTQARSR